MELASGSYPRGASGNGKCVHSVNSRSENKFRDVDKMRISAGVL